MSVIELLTEVSARGAEAYVRGGDVYLRPADKLDNDLLGALRLHKAAIFSELRRDAAVADAWERLRDVYVRAGQPDGWITDAVRRAECAVDALWKSARKNDHDDEQFHAAVRRWEATVRASIIEAAQ